MDEVAQLDQMESILENIVNAIEAVWFKLATVLNLEEMDAVSSLKPVLTNILSDPLLLGLTLAIFATFLSRLPIYRGPTVYLPVHSRAQVQS